MVQDGAGQQPQEVACRTNARQRSCLSGVAAECVRRVPARVNQPQVDLDQRFVLLFGAYVFAPSKSSKRLSHVWSTHSGSGNTTISPRVLKLRRVVAKEGRSFCDFNVSSGLHSMLFDHGLWPCAFTISANAVMGLSVFADVTHDTRDLMLFPTGISQFRGHGMPEIDRGNSFPQLRKKCSPRSIQIHPQTL